MNDRIANLVIGLVFAAAVAVGGVMNHRVSGLRESEALYRWIIAAATDKNLSEHRDTDYKDYGLFEDVRGLGEKLLPEPGTDVAKNGGEKLVLLARTSTALGAVGELNKLSPEDVRNQRAIFDMARSPELAPARKKFIQLARNNQLEFAKNIQYAEAAAGGVNIFNLFFGFRQVAANFVWLQVDRFWHEGMMHRMIPLMKTCVVLDPHFVDAYLLGAWHLAYNVTAKMPDTPMALREWNPDFRACVGEKEGYYYIAANFLKDGIRNNPRNYKLYFDLGFALYSEKLKDYPNAVKYLEEAVRQPHERWVPRMLYKNYELNGQFAQAKQGWEGYIKAFPDTAGGSDTGPRAIIRLGALDDEQRAEILQREAAALKEKDPAAAEAKEKEAAAAFEAAKSVYAKSDESFAKAHLSRIEARALAKDGRYVEAIAVLDRARWDYTNPNFFDDASNLIIEYKQKANIPLSLSERKAVIRAEGGDKCKGEPDDAAPKSTTPNPVTGT